MWSMKPIKTGYAVNPAILVTALFVALKVVGVIAWSWWIVLSPLLFLALLVMVALTFMASIFLAACIYIYFEDRKPR